MRTDSTILALLLTGSLVSGKYTVDIPEDAIWVTDWDQLHEMATRYPNTALEPKYGGNVIEVDGKIILATDEEMTKQIDDLVQELEKSDAKVSAEPKISKR